MNMSGVTTRYFKRKASVGLSLPTRMVRRLGMFLLRPMFGKIGKNVWFDPFGTYSYSNIFLGDDCFLGVRASIVASNSTVSIGNKVMFGPEVVIRGGTHQIDLIGKYMKDIREADKPQSLDLGVIIQDDVWVGTRACILQGVTLHRGSVVGGGAVVTRSVPPYAVVGGVPAKIIRYRGTVEEILKHEEILYGTDLRIDAAALRAYQSQGNCL